MIHHKRLLEKFFHLVQISSPSGKDRQAPNALLLRKPLIP